MREYVNCMREYVDPHAKVLAACVNTWLHENLSGIGSWR